MTSVFTLCTDGVRDVVDANVAQTLVQDMGDKYDKLVLGGKSLSLDGAEIIASKLNNIEGLREIDMADIIASRPEDEAKMVLSVLSQSLDCSSLLSLDVSDNALGLKGVRAISSLLSQSRETLQSLTINNNGLEARAARLIALLLTTSDSAESMSRVPLPHPDDNDETIRSILYDDEESGDVVLNTSLTRFHTFNNLLESAGVCALSRLLLHSPSLTDVRVSSTRVSSDGAQSLSRSLAPLTQLQRLDLSDNSFGADASAALASSVIANQAQLTHLNLAATALEDNGCVALCKALVGSGCRLETLDLSCNELTGDVASDLADALKKVGGTLQVLKLSENELGSNGTPPIVAALAGGAVRSIDLSVNEITISGANAMALLLPQLESLERLELNGNLIAQEGVERLQSILADRSVSLGDMDLNDDEYEEEEEDADADAIAEAIAHLTV